MFYRVESDVVPNIRESHAGPSHCRPKQAWLPTNDNSVPIHGGFVYQNETASTAEQLVTVLMETEF